MRLLLHCFITAFLAVNLGASGLLINEISVRGENWVEIYNTGSTPVDLEGYRLMNSVSQDPLGGTVPAHGYLIVAASVKRFRHLFPEVEVEIYQVPDREIGSGLNSDREMLALVDPEGHIVDLVNWGNPDPLWPNFCSFLWVPGVMTQEPYLARMPNGKDTDRPTDFTGVFEPTPGEKNPAPMGLSTASWGKIKALFSGNPRK